MTSQQAVAMLRDIFKGNDAASFNIRLWDDTEETVGSDPRCTLVFRDESTFADLFRSQDAYKFAIAFMQDRFDIEGDLFAALRLQSALKSMKIRALTKLTAALKLGVRSRHSREADKQNIQAHYDVSNEFYKLFLDTQNMAYSCAYYHSQQESLEDAQTHKLDLICRKLRLKAGESFLDIGCGWGGLLIHAAKHYGVMGHGITLSQNQYDLARQRVAEAGLSDKITIEIRDYRDLPDASFDKIASVGMIEHVGIAKYPEYFRTMHRLLKPGGLFLNHGITANRVGPGFGGDSKFMFTVIFPNAELDNISHTETVVEDMGFEILNVESLREHYAKTLTEWYTRLIAHETEALTMVPKDVYRAWKLYLAGCVLVFENARVSIYQTLMAKPSGSFTNVPLTMRDVYDF